MSEQKPVIIKKIKKGHHGHHGGAWKLAYADFVTAMMAFFLLMWLLGSTTSGDLQGIAEYFQNPYKVAMSGGSGAGDAVSVIKGGGEDLSRAVGQVKRTNDGKRQIIAKAREDDSGRLRELRDKIDRLIGASPTLRNYRSQLKLDITREGLRIQIVDAANRPMFELASAQMQPYAKEILKEIAPLINELPNVISVSGHTDARPFQGGQRGYSNWELSADRANAARKELVAAGLQEGKMLRVMGLADSVPLVADDPLAPTNRRIAIIVMNSETEAYVRANTGDAVDVDGSAPLAPGQLNPERSAAPKPPAGAPAPSVPTAPAAPAAPANGTLPPQGSAGKPAPAPALAPGTPITVPPVLPPGLVPSQPAPMPARPASP
ncbi:chemotaxis protein MotB [Plasticicumulans lactativorans]|uniref:Chemotaxis protein MotB n=1 Tax=Plasticicumulans lactativorans TaxID=1133106 RepID=A0A4R2LAV1_9GAMM|nr:flagellar motor protein MotB [Plasticicumulans lactativorans]TCO83430.1 chemotaxis protein MotB [Plasticicumulans lactativorans]